MEPMLDIKDLMNYLKIGKNKAYNLMRSDSFPSIKIGSQYRVRKEDLEEFINEYRYSEFMLGA